MYRQVSQGLEKGLEFNVDIPDLEMVGNFFLQIVLGTQCRAGSCDVKTAEVKGGNKIGFTPTVHTGPRGDQKSTPAVREAGGSINHIHSLAALSKSLNVYFICYNQQCEIML